MTTICRVLIAVIAAGLVPATAVAAAPLALARGDVPGLGARAMRGSEARSIVIGVAPARLRPSLRRAPLQRSAFRLGRLSLVSVVATLASERRATTVLAGIRGRRVSIGDGARVRSTRAHGTATAIAVLRFGEYLGVIRVRLPGRRDAAERRATGYARVLAARIARLRGRPGWDRLMHGLQPDGTMPLGVALRAFALEYGAMPGVRRPTGAASFDGTAALGGVLAHWSQLTAAQRSAVRDVGLGRSAVSAATRRVSPITLTPSPQYQTVAQGAATIYASHLGPLPFPIVVSRASRGRTDIAALADAAPVPEAAPTRCEIRLFPSLFTGTSEALRSFVIAHETFHCFEFAATPGWVTMPASVIEGMAEWAGLAGTNAASEPEATAFLARYYTSPGTSLLQRTYDAVGFWGFIDQYVAGGLWPRVGATLRSGSGAAAFVTAGGNLDVTAQTWASSQMRASERGPAWLQVDPVALSTGVADSPQTAVEGTATISTAPYTTALYEVRPQSKPRLVLVTRTRGHVRASTSTHDIPDAGGLWFCNGGKCSCKAGETSNIPDHTNVDAYLNLALTGGSGPGAARVEYRDPAEFCGSRPRVWEGTWASAVYPGLAGGFRLVLGGPDSSLAGTISITGSPCISGGSATGTIVNTQIRLGAVHAEREVAYNGRLVGSAVAGTWTSPSCGTDRGTFSGTRQTSTLTRSPG